MTNKAYHHGNLRSTLIQSGVALLQEGSVDALSLRKLAREAGVSHNAPYMHFPDKEALLAAIAEEGFKLLCEAIVAGVDADNPEWLERFQSGCWAYVQFVVDHPAHAQVMFRSYDPKAYPEVFEASMQALDLLEQPIKTGIKINCVKDHDTKTYATMMWSLLHGVATIFAARKMPPYMDDRTQKEIVYSYIQLVYEGLKP